MRILRLAMLFLVIVQAQTAAYAVELDISVHDEVIGRLESALPETEYVQSRTSIQIRLADLYADRARLKALKLQDGVCAECSDVKSDRDLAIKYYSDAFAQANDEQKVKSLLQRAHLHSLNGDNDKSKNIFVKILLDKNKYSKSIYGEAHAGLGEIAYRSGEFEIAKSEYAKALNYKIRSANLVQYRLAWCEFNSGNISNAERISVQLLKSAQLNDHSFRRDIARDLVTFVARLPVTNKSVQDLLSVTPKEDHKANLFLLGQETDRLGNKSGSLLVWNKYAQLTDVSPNESLEIQIRSAQIYYDQGNYEVANRLYENFLNSLKKMCQDIEKCDELKSRARSYVLNWIKKEKTDPSKELIKALDLYTKAVDNDAEMLQWTGHIARVQKNYKLAIEKYSISADLAHKTGNQKALEGSLLFEVETAELAQDNNLRLRAYEHYLDKNPKGTKVNEIKYQRAYVSYNLKKYSEAFDLFNEIANDKSSAYQITSAELALDTLVLQNRTNDLIEYSQKYAQAIPAKRLSFLAISRKASVNKAVAAYQKKSSSTSELKESYDLLDQSPMAGASKNERIQIYKNQTLLAEQMEDLDLIDKSADRLIANNATGANREFALSRKFYVATKRQDFNSAYQIATRMQLNDLPKSEKFLKLALLAELANRPSRHHYEKYIQHAKDITKANTIRLRFVKESLAPWKELNKHKKHFAKTPAIYSQAVIEAFARSANYKELKAHLQNRQIKNGQYAGTFKKFLELQDTLPFLNRLSRHKLVTSNDRALKRSIQTRTTMIKDLSQLARKTSAKSSVTMQILTVSTLAKESERFHKELLDLPTPKGLTPKEKEQYQNLLKIRAQPFETTAKAEWQKVERLFKNSKSVNQMINLSPAITYAEAKLINRELKLIQPYAPRTYSYDIAKAIKKTDEMQPENNIKSEFLAQMQNGRLK